ncbi:MAG: hypothetical protein JWN64_359 [Parcubacteria group bacterium]|nr:hypothetical protein [Parcubacteria group bacterium]
MQDYISADFPPLPGRGKPTTITWKDGSGHPDEPVYTQCNCISISASSGLSRYAELELDLLALSADGRKGRVPTFDLHKAIVDRLEQLVTDHPEIILLSEGRYKPVVRLPLRNGEQFCERAIEFVSDIFKNLGLEDPKGHLRANFTITQETYVLANNREERPSMRYEDWLRNKYGLKLLILNSGN